MGFKGFDHALRVGGLVLRSVAYGVPAVRRHCDADLAMQLRALKLDADGLVVVENAAVVAIGAAPTGPEECITV